MRLADDHRPVPIFVAVRDGQPQDDSEPIDPGWLGVIEWSEDERNS